MKTISISGYCNIASGTSYKHKMICEGGVVNLTRSRLLVQMLKVSLWHSKTLRTDN